MIKSKKVVEITSKFPMRRSVEEIKEYNCIYIVNNFIVYLIFF